MSWRIGSGFFLLITGGILLIVSLLGELTQLGMYESLIGKDWDRVDSRLVASTRNVASLVAKVDERLLPGMSSQDKMEIIFDLVTQRFTHGNKSKYNVFSNWILYVMGWVNSKFSYIRDLDHLLRYGHSAFCSEQSYVMLFLAEHFGIRSRHVGLNGHVVMEAWYDNGWHMYDPDFEVKASLTNKNILSVENLSKDTDLIQKIYAPKTTFKQLNRIIDIITSSEDNLDIGYPRQYRLLGFEFNTNQSIALYIQNFANWLKFPVLLVMIALGLLMTLPYFRKK